MESGRGKRVVKALFAFEEEVSGCLNFGPGQLFEGASEGAGEGVSEGVEERVKECVSVKGRGKKERAKERLVSCLACHDFFFFFCASHFQQFVFTVSREKY